MLQHTLLNESATVDVATKAVYVKSPEVIATKCLHVKMEDLALTNQTLNFTASVTQNTLVQLVTMTLSLYPVKIILAGLEHARWSTISLLVFATKATLEVNV